MKYLKTSINCDTRKKMAYSAESSPVEYFDSCCICDEEFYSNVELANHLLEHADEEEFKAGLEKIEQTKSVPERRKSGNFIAQPMKRSFTQRSKSPEIVELLSDESDDESAKNKKQPPPPVVASNKVKPLTTANVAKLNQISQNPAQNTPTPKAALLGIYNCTQCSVVFKDLKLYKEHLATHDKARPYACQICNKKFAYKGTLRQHLHLHIGEKSHECKVCHKKFSLKRMLRQHEETHEQEQHQGVTISKV